jgi:excisionase family DNA binding protein
VTLEPLLSPEDIAGLTGTSYHGVLRDIRSGKLRATKKGKGYRVEVQWYRDWLEADIVTPRRPRPVAAVSRRRGPVLVGSVDALDAIEAEAR